MSVFRHQEPIRRRKNWLLRVVVTLTLLLVIFVTSTAVWYKANIRAVDLSNNTLQEITISPGDSEADISNLLESEGLIKSATAYRLFTRFNDLRGISQAGIYELTPAMNISDIVDKLVNGDVKAELMTILPAQRLDDLKKMFMEKGYSASEVEDALNPALYTGHPALVDKPKLANLEGYLYPESYQYTATTPLRAIIESSLDQTAKLFTPQIKQKLTVQGLSLNQAVIIASIIEKEVSEEEDKATVAQVFLTRYSRGMALGSDVTAFYGASLVGKDESVNTDTPYNTRIHSGLPPGPISNISSSSLLAVANPTDTDYLFFVTGDDGTTYFSRTLAEHEALAAQYCKLRC